MSHFFLKITVWYDRFREILYTALGIYLIVLLLRYPVLSLQYAATGLQLWFRNSDRHESDGKIRESAASSFTYHLPHHAKRLLYSVYGLFVRFSHGRPDRRTASGTGKTVPKGRELSARLLQ